MTSIVKFTAISGTTTDEPLCYLLSVDNFCFLLDCGWNDMYDMSLMEKLKTYVSRIDAVLLSHCDLTHLGGLPYLVGKLKLSCPVYATLPVYEMGQMFMYDLFESHNEYEDFNLFTLDDIDAAFSLFETLKYQQVKHIHEKGSDIKITPLNAGHLIGGTIWVINTDQEEFVYAVNFDHKKGRMLQGADLSKIVRPSLLITDTNNGLIKVFSKRDVRETELMEIILETITNNGNVLLPVDTAGRILELGLLFDQTKTFLAQQYQQKLLHSKDENVSDFSIVWLNTQVDPIIKFAMSTLEWMNDDLVNMFEESRRNPFDFKAERSIKTITTIEELRKMKGPLVVMTSQDTLNTGFARHLFSEWSSSEKNCIIFTAIPNKESLSYDLCVKGIKYFDLMMNYKIPLEGKEFEEFIYEKKKEIEIQRKKEIEEMEMKRIEELELEEDEENNDNINPLLTIRHDLPIDIDTETSFEFFKYSTRYPMYPCIEAKIRMDDYGGIVRVEDLIQSAENHSVNIKAMIRKKKIEQEHEFERKIKIEAKRCVKELVSVTVRAKIHYINFESRSDGPSALEFIKLMNPRKLILINGNDETNDFFTQTFLSNPKEVGQVLVPLENQTIDVTSELNIYQGTLTDNLMNQLLFQTIHHGGEEFEICRADCVIVMNENQSVPSLEPSSTYSDQNSVFVGEMVLSSKQFLQILKESGFNVKFIEGSLICDDLYRIRKEEGRIVVEGPVSSDYYKLRKLLYSQFAIV